MPRYPFDQLVSWLGESEPEEVMVTPATYWQTSLDVYAVFQGIDRIEEYVPPFGSPAPPLDVDDVTEICRMTPAALVVVPFRQESDQWIPLFMAPEEAGRLAGESELGFGEREIFGLGSHRLDLYDCPTSANAASGMD